MENSNVELEALKGRSFPSAKFGAWIVDHVSPTLEGRSRLVSGNLKHDQWVWTRELVRLFEELDKERQSASGSNAEL